MVLYNSPLLLIGNNSLFYIIPLLMLIFIQCIWRLCFTFHPAFSASYIIIQISLFIYTIYNPDGLYSDKDDDDVHDVDGDDDDDDDDDGNDGNGDDDDYDD